MSSTNPKKRKFTIKVNDKGELVGLQIDGKEVAAEFKVLAGYDYPYITYKGFKGASETLWFNMVKGKPKIYLSSAEFDAYNPKAEFIDFVPNNSKAADKAQSLNDAKSGVRAAKPAPAPARAPAADSDKHYRLGAPDEAPFPNPTTPAPSIKPEKDVWTWNKYQGRWGFDGEQLMNDGESGEDYIKRIKRNRSQRIKKAAEPAAPPAPPPGHVPAVKTGTASTKVPAYIKFEYPNMLWYRAKELIRAIPLMKAGKSDDSVNRLLKKEGLRPKDAGVVYGSQALFLLLRDKESLVTGRSNSRTDRKSLLDKYGDAVVADAKEIMKLPEAPPYNTDLGAYKDDEEPAAAPAPAAAPEPKKKFVVKKKPAPPLAPIKGKFAPQKEAIPERDEPLTATAVPARKKFVIKKPEPPARPLSEFEKAKKVGWGLIHHIYRFHKITTDYGHFGI